MNIKPVGERVLVKPIKIEEKTTSGIILSSNSTKSMLHTAEIIAIGNLEKEKEIKVGLKVIYSQLSGAEITNENEKYLILNIEDILAMVD